MRMTNGFARLGGGSGRDPAGRTGRVRRGGRGNARRGAGMRGEARECRDMIGSDKGCHEYVWLEWIQLVTYGCISRVIHAKLPCCEDSKFWNNRCGVLVSSLNNISDFGTINLRRPKRASIAIQELKSTPLRRRSFVKGLQHEPRTKFLLQQLRWHFNDNK